MSTTQNVPRPAPAARRAGAPAGLGVPRALAALGALALVASLFLQWAYDRRPEPDVALTAWEVYARTDLALAALALVALAGVAVAHRLGPPVALGAGALALALTLRQFLLSDPGRGGRVALLGAALLIAAALLRLAPEAVRARIAMPVARGGTSGPRALLARAEDLARRVVDSPVTLLGVAGLVAYSTFPLRTLQPGGGTDGSWVAALHVAAEQGLDFGTEIVFTYGPLGYLTVPRLFYADLALQGFLYVAIVHVALTVALLWNARRSFGLPVGLVVTVVTLAALRNVSPDETTQLGVVSLVFALCLGALRAPSVGASRLWLPLVAAGGAVAAAHALVKLNTGLLCGALIAVTALAAAPPRRRLASAGAFLGAFVVALGVLWTVLDQDFGDMDAYLRRSFEVIAGYAEYQYTEEEGREWEYLAAAVVTAVLAGTALAATEGWGWLRRGAALLLTAGYVFVWFKQGFVRHDGHSLAFFAAALTGGIALGWSRRPPVAGWAGAGVLLVALLAVMRPIPWEFHRPADTRAVVREHLTHLRDPEPYIAAQREELRRAQEIDEEALALVRGRTTHIFPTEASVAWSQPDISWRPLPVFQGYQAYTDDLDDLNAGLLAGERAPERILRTDEFSSFENPGAVRELLCRYRELRAGEKWQVLTRVPDRCGPLRRLGRVRTVTDAPLALPRAGAREAVLMVIHDFEPAGREALRALVWKPYERSVQIDDEEYRRVAVDLADEPSLVRVPSRVDYSGRFRLDPDVDAHVRVILQGQGVFGPSERIPRPVEVEFLAMPVRAG